jgi:phosphoenolpyruvate carboxykinase (GTP)
VAATNNPALDAAWDDPAGVPIDAFIFGGRRSTTVPLVTEARDWTEGVYMGATMGSETTAAAFGAQGVVRRDPFAMLPFCGYNMATTSALAPAGRGAAGARRPPARHLLRQLVPQGRRGPLRLAGLRRQHARAGWMIDRIEGRAAGQATAFGVTPRYEEINWQGLAFTPAQFATVTHLDGAAWRDEFKLHDELFARLADRLPKALSETRRALEQRFSAVA